ncbi:DNA excision repair protein ERCC-1 isoform X1 [Benincasa hispida]|uniref:DNA excision repair protein ERCC-1 isoform X1 n=1 Tax=Benincasa hispida TaxID=102211 RepID=UPI0019019039|nr:DNA excision repair protein ERCC-1 isoform X1 [Benincasa hispida]XP_038884593.1 DNA excision repair protein ERCC-1 isoform X1 [Benincasa hispida]
MEEGNEEENLQQTAHKKSKTIIKIPSYQEVIESSQPKSQSFSQAFAFLKSSEFYSPPPKPASASSSQSLSASEITNPRKNDQLDTSSSSTSASTTTPNNSSSVPSSVSHNAILVSNRQKGNPLLKHVRNVRWAFADVVPDYLLGQSSCALYLSLRYHLLHPDYLYYRIRELQKNFKLRVVLCHVDVEDVVKPLLEVTKTALLHDCTLLCAWSLEECGRYLETIKVYENKPADLIQGQMDTDYLSRLTHVLTSVRHVNKTDVVTLGTTFGSLSHIMDASMEDLARCPGIGERKVRRLYDTFHEPFKRIVSTHPGAPETPTQNNTKPRSMDEEQDVDEKRTEDGSQHKKEPELNIKSALSAAFAKYADKIGKNCSMPRGEERGEPESSNLQ